MKKHFHFDVVGGISGDMFIGAFLQIDPTLFEQLPIQLEKAGFKNLVELSFESFNDGVLTGAKFTVKERRVNKNERHHHEGHHHEGHHHEGHRHEGHHHEGHHHEGHHHEGHHHRHFSEIKKILHTSELSEDILEVALEIFQIVAEAEAAVHNKSIDEIAFHEVGAWDSIADIVCASFLINHFKGSSYSSSKLPLGKGRVLTDHGWLPIPAPATSLILKGYDFYTDEAEGERITPTGAAIFKYLNPTQKQFGEGILIEQTYGFGDRRFEGMSNVFRVSEFEMSISKRKYDQIDKLTFEIDDMTQEELGNFLELTRDRGGVLECFNSVVYGKKNRLVNRIEILVEERSLNDISDWCLTETTTLGMRVEKIKRRILERSIDEIEIDNKSYKAKIANRKLGSTVKIEADSLKEYNLFEQRKIQGKAFEKINAINNGK